MTKEDFDKAARLCCEEVNDFLSQWGFATKYIDDYSFDDDPTQYDGESLKDMVALYCASLQTDVRIFPVALNQRLLEMYTTPDELIDQILMSFYHEAGHGIMWYLTEETGIEFLSEKEVAAEEFAEDCMGNTDKSEIMNRLQEWEKGEIEWGSD